MNRNHWKCCGHGYVKGVVLSVLNWWKKSFTYYMRLYFVSFAYMNDTCRCNSSPLLFDIIFHTHTGERWILETVVNWLRPRQTGRQFPDDILKCIFLTENVIISIKMSLKFVPKGSINNIATLVQIMAWRRPGEKPLSEPMMVWLSTHICVTRPQWVKSDRICVTGVKGFYNTSIP